MTSPRTPLTNASAGICIKISAPKRQIVVCFNLPSVWRVDIWQFSLSEKSTYIFLTADNLVFFPISWHLNLPYVGKKSHPSGARSSLRLTLYVICKANCNHRDHFCCQSQSPSFSLSVCCRESSLFSCFLSLLCLFGFQCASFNTHLSVASFYSHRLCHFLLFVPLFACRFPVSAAL